MRKKHRPVVVVAMVWLAAGVGPDGSLRPVQVQAAGMPAEGAAGQQPSAAGGSGTWAPPRTPWGHPDLQGLWTNATTTPLERPSTLSGREFLTDGERAALDEQRAQNADRPPRPGDTGSYNSFWLEQGKASNQTSLIVDPPDGRLPALTPEGQRKAAAIAALRERSPDDWTEVNIFERCITRGMPGVMMPGFYNHNYQIVQTPGYVVLLAEMIHDARIIPLDGRPHMPSGLRLWNGDSRGRWEGDTLVVETTNFNDEIHERRPSNAVFGTGKDLVLVERFRRVAADTIDYRFTVTAPGTFTKPWTAATPMSRIDAPIFEYACHEGNYALPNILRGAREQEKAAGGGSER